MTWLYTLSSVVFVSVVSFTGIVVLFWGPGRIERLMFFLVSFAVGALLGDAFIHLLPESFRKIGINLQASLYCLLGIVSFFIMEKLIRWRHVHVRHSAENPHPVAFMNLVGDAVHNLMDGILIGASYLASIPIGMTTTIAVILHEIPQEIGDFAILVHSGFSPKKALFYNLLSALFAVIGAVVSLMIGSYFQQNLNWLIPFTAGGFIYIAGADLIPELQQEVRFSTSLRQLLSILAGIGVMAALLILE